MLQFVIQVGVLGWHFGGGNQGYFRIRQFAGTDNTPARSSNLEIEINSTQECTLVLEIQRGQGMLAQPVLGKFEHQVIISAAHLNRG